MLNQINLKIFQSSRYHENNYLQERGTGYHENYNVELLGLK